MKFIIKLIFNLICISDCRKEHYKGITAFFLSDKASTNIDRCCVYNLKVNKKPNIIICSHRKTDEFKNGKVKEKEEIRILVETTFKFIESNGVSNICTKCWKNLKKLKNTIFIIMNNKKDQNIMVSTSCENNTFINEYETYSGDYQNKPKNLNKNKVKTFQVQKNQNFMITNKYIKIMCEHNRYVVPVILHEGQEKVIVFKDNQKRTLFSTIEDSFIFFSLYYVKNKKVDLISGPIFQCDFIEIMNGEILLEPLNKLVFIDKNDEIISLFSKKILHDMKNDVLEEKKKIDDENTK